MPHATFLNLPEEKRDKFLECAIAEFAEHDYDSASISKIVAKAGIAKGSLYQYFTDKKDLHSYLLELAVQKKAEMLGAAKPPESNAALFDRLRWLFEEMAKYEIQYPQLAKIGYRAAYGKSPMPEEIVAKGREATLQYFRLLFEQGKQNGEIKPDIDSSAGAFVFTAVLTQLGDFLAVNAGVVTSDIANRGAYPTHVPVVRQMFDQIIAIFQYGMAK